MCAHTYLKLVLISNQWIDDESQARSSAISDQLTSRTGPVTSPYLFVRRCAPSSSPSNPQQVQSALNSVQRSFIAPNIAFYEDWVCWILWHFIAPVGSQRFFELVNFGRTKPKRKASDQHKSACRSTYVKLLTAKVNYGVFTKCWSFNLSGPAMHPKQRHCQ
jgi:hypothetical protein